VAAGSGGDIGLAGYTNADLEGSDRQPGYSQTFVPKLAPGGERLWLRQHGRRPTELKTGAAVDAQGCVLVVSTGTFASAGAGNAAAAGAAGSRNGSGTPPAPVPLHVLVVRYPP